MSTTKIATKAIVTTIVGGELRESEHYLGARRKAMTYRGARRLLSKELPGFVDVVRLETWSVAAD